LTENNDQFFFEITMYRMVRRLWNHPELYIKKSPIMCVDKVTKPLLLINNRKNEILTFPRMLECLLR
jgi:hypothetical protein